MPKSLLTYIISDDQSLVDDMGLMDTSDLISWLTRTANRNATPLNDWYRTPNMERLAKQGMIAFPKTYRP